MSCDDSWLARNLVDYSCFEDELQICALPIARREPLCLSKAVGVREALPCSFGAHGV